MAHEDLVALLRHPEVKQHLDENILSGLSGTCRIDYAIGVIERALKEMEATGTSYSTLAFGYEKLRKNPKYKSYFTGKEFLLREQEEDKK